MHNQIQAFDSGKLLQNVGVTIPPVSVGTLCQFKNLFGSFALASSSFKRVICYFQACHCELKPTERLYDVIVRL